MRQVDFIIKCSINTYGEFTDEDGELEITNLESLLKENGYKRIEVEIED